MKFQDKFEEYMFQRYCYNKYRIWSLIKKEKELNKLIKAMKNGEIEKERIIATIKETFEKNDKIKSFEDFLKDEYEDGSKLYEIIESEGILIDEERMQKLITYVEDENRRCYYNGFGNGYINGESAEMEKGNKPLPKSPETLQEEIKNLLK